MYDVFISYSRKDIHVADLICKSFDKAGISYFIDRQGINGACEFPTVLAEAIVSSKFFLFLASRNSYESKFTQSEIIFAFNRKSKGAILPYIIDDSTMPISLEFVFSAINWRNIHEHPIETILVKDLLHLLGRDSEQLLHDVKYDNNGQKQDKASSQADRDSVNLKKWLLPTIGFTLLLPLIAYFLFKPSNSNDNALGGGGFNELPVIVALSNDTTDHQDVQTDSVVMNEDIPVVVNGVTFTMKHIPSGEYLMGATQEQPGVSKDEKPAHKVMLNKDYYIGETEVTQLLWTAVMGGNPSSFKGNERPVEQVSYEDCMNFIQKINEMSGLSFRLPTEAEWEYAARGGKESRKSVYSGSNTLGKVGWYTANSAGHTHGVKGKDANELGLYDMTGNVWEWCSDWYGNYTSHDIADPQGASSGKFRVYRGGCWCCDASYSLLTVRGYDYPHYRSPEVGLRLALDCD